jgi:hypothetical protein
MRDKSNADMKQEIDSQRREIDSLRQRIRDMCAVTITNGNGNDLVLHAIYARAQWDDGEFKFYSSSANPPTQYSVPIHQSHQPVSFDALGDLHDLKIDIGQISIPFPFDERYELVENRNWPYGEWCFFGSDDDGSPIQSVIVEIGPFNSEQEELDDFDPHDWGYNLDGEPLTASFLSVEFHPRAFRGDFRPHAFRGPIENDLHRQEPSRSLQVPSSPSPPHRAQACPDSLEFPGLTDDEGDNDSAVPFSDPRSPAPSDNEDDNNNDSSAWPSHFFSSL